MKNLFKLVISVVIIATSSSFCVAQSNPQNPNTKLLSLSEKLLYRVKTDAPVDTFQRDLARYSVSDVVSGLPNDNAKKAFWLNIYNAYYQLLATQKHLPKAKIFATKCIQFTDTTLSLDDVEHGILRKRKWKFGLGYIPDFLPAKNTKQLAVAQVDYRIHFALNCGAKSCPPIAFYTYDKINIQLELATRTFLQGETEVNEATKTVHTTKIMEWFSGDFGGAKGVKKILGTYLSKDLSAYKVKFRAYNWSEELNNYK